MHSLSFLLAFLVAATHGSNEFQVVHVTCGQPFTLQCSFNETGSCVWQRNGSVVKTDGIRYSSTEEKLANGKKCLFLAAKAEIESDFGQWTCGATANDAHDGKTFKDISVNVTYNGSTCTYFQDLPRKNNSSKITEQVDPIKSNDTLYIIIGVLSSALLLFVMVALIFYYMKKGKSRKAKSPAQSIHDYEEINETNFNEPGSNTGEQQECQAITLKIGNTETMIPITEIFQNDGYEMPLSNKKQTLSRADSGATFKLIAVRQPSEQSQRNSAYFPTQAKFLKELHDYQNIRPTMLV